MRIDEFFYKQPEPQFIDWLNRPLHEEAPEHFAKAVPGADEVWAKGAYIAECCLQWQRIMAPKACK